MSTVSMLTIAIIHVLSFIVYDMYKKWSPKKTCRLANIFWYHDIIMIIIFLSCHAYAAFLFHTVISFRLFSLLGVKLCYGRRRPSWRVRRAQPWIRRRVRVRSARWSRRSTGCRSDTHSWWSSRRRWSRRWRSPCPGASPVRSMIGIIKIKQS